MTAPEIEQLERHAELVRNRLAGNLDRLLGDGASDVTGRVVSEAAETRDELVGRAKHAVRRRADGVLDGIKDRIAANPAAALAIGSGIAWRLYRYPPIATVLIGAGLVSLLRTDPNQLPATRRLGKHAAEMADSVRGRIGDLQEKVRSVDPSVEAKRLAGAAAEELGDLAGSARRRVTALADSAAEQAGEWGSGASRAARRQVRQAAGAADRWAATGRRRVARAMPDGTRDQYLLGAVALALVAAVGIASQRRYAASAPGTKRAAAAKSGKDRPARARTGQQRAAAASSKRANGARRRKK